MSPAEVVRLRLDAQRISATPFTRPDEVVAWLGAVQAQDYLGALWAVGLRLPQACEKDIERALADRSIVRTWPMRGTLHFVAAADARWMVELLGPKVVAGAASRFRALDLDEATIARARRVLVKRLEGGRSLTRPAAYEALERAKVSTAGQRGIHILWRLAHESLVCFGPREGKQQTVVLVDEWLPRARRLPHEEALAELACRYFTGHGPATAADFAWWSGLNLSNSRLAVRLAGQRLDEESIGGKAHWFARPAAPSPAPRSRAYLLPAFDEFVVAYADRSAALEPARMKQVNAGGGILKPTIVVDGRIVGTWKRRLARAEVVFSPAMFATLSQSKMRAVALALRRYAEFLGVRARAEP
jgi:winged helix DNA-binding protein